MNMKGKIVARYGSQLKGHRDWLRSVDKDDQIAVIDNMMAAGEYGHLGGQTRAATAFRDRNGRFVKNPYGQQKRWLKAMARFQIGQSFRINDGDWGWSTVTIHQIVTERKHIQSIYPILPVPPVLVQFLIEADDNDAPAFVDELDAPAFVQYIGDARPINHGGQNDHPVD